MARHTSVYGLYPDEATVHDAAAALKAAGFKDGDLSVLVSDNVGTKDLAHERHSKAPEGATLGGALLGVFAAILGYLIAAGNISVPGSEALVSAGPILAALGGLGAGTVIGAITGGLVGMGIPEYEAKRYMGRIRRSGILLSVHCDDHHWTGPAKSILRKTGARGIGVRSEGRADRVARHKPLVKAS